MSEFYLSEINIYPIKSLGGMAVTSGNVEAQGLQYDRRWMLIDNEGNFITQRKHFQLALLKVGTACGKVIVSYKGDASQQLSFFISEHEEERIPVRIWDDVSSGQEVSAVVSDWFSDFMKMKVKLVKMPANEKRAVDSRYALADEIVSFADAYPFMVVGQSSLDGLNEKLKVSLPMDRFRPNFVFSGGSAHVEDSFKTFQINDVIFSAVKPCARCVLTTVDQQTAERGQEPLKTLSQYRTFDKKVMFGQNLVHRGQGIVSIGDELRVLEWK